MLSKGDDFPIHQSPEPIAYAGQSRKFAREALALPMRGVDGNHKQRRGFAQIYQRIQNIRAQMTIGKCTGADHRAIMRSRQRQSLF